MKFDRISEDVSSKAYRLESSVPYEKVGVADPDRTVKREVTLRNLSSTQLILEYEQMSATDYQSKEGESYTVRLTSFPTNVRIRDITVVLLGKSEGRLTYMISAR